MIDILNDMKNLLITGRKGKKLGPAPIVEFHAIVEFHPIVEFHARESAI